MPPLSFQNKNVSRATGRKSPQEILRDIEEQLQRNRGGFFAAGEDTGSSIPFILPGGGVNRTIAQSPTAQAPNLQLPDMQDYSYEYPDLPWDTGDQSSGGQAGDSIINDFLNYYNPTVQPIGQNQDGSVVLPDGATLSPTGELRNAQGNLIEGVASLPGGYTLYSDGSVRLGGLEDLIYGIFGSNQLITQAYGNYNPDLEPGSGYNLGTDIRTSDLAERGQYLPDDVMVVQITQDDGTRWGDISGHDGYGNSILVQLPSGEMLRFSHLAQLPDGIQEGSTIGAGTPFIFPGATGNVTGEHLDLEYYTPDGQISSPDQFQGFQNFRGVTGELTPLEQLSPEIQQTVAELQAQNAAQPSYSGYVENAPNNAIGTQEPEPQSPMQSAIQDTVQPVMQTATRVAQPLETATKEVLQPAMENYQLLRPSQYVANAVMKRPGLGLNELAQGNIQGFRNALSGAAEQIIPKSNFDFGGTELLRGDLEGARSVQAATARNIGTKFPQLESFTDRISQGLIPDVYASGGIQPKTQSSVSPDQRPNYMNMLDDAYQAAVSRKDQIGNQISDTADNIKFRAGEGVDRLKQGVSSLFSGGENAGLFSRINLSDLANKRAVGEVSGQSSVLPPQQSASLLASQAPNDIRDPFFKQGLDQQYSEYIDPAKVSSGALTTDLFSKNFYQDPTRVKTAFAGTYLAPKAQDMYVDQLKQQYRDTYSGSDYDQGDVERILNSIGNTSLGYTPNLPAPKLLPQEPAPTYEQWASRISDGNKSYDRFLAETGGQSELDALRRSGGDVGAYVQDRANIQAGGVSSGAQQNFTPAYANFSSVSGNASYAPAPSRTTATQSFTPSNANYTSAKTGRPAYAPAPQQSNNLFNRAASFAKNIFTRFLN